MLKSLIWLLAAISFLLAGYYWHYARTSYSAYSDEQLGLFGRELQRMSASDAGVTIEDRVTADLAASELTRRARIPMFAIAGIVLLVLAIAIPTRSGSRSRGESGEERRLKQFIGAVPQAGPNQPPMDKYRAAEALGVRLDASPAVVQAAFDALIKERSESRRDGLAPDLQRLMDEQLRALHEAREVLLGKRFV